MCYSAQIKAEYKKFVRMFGALMSLKDFAKLYVERELDARIKIPKSMDALFMALQPGRPLRANRVQRRVERNNLGVDGQLAKAARDELRVLRAEIENENRLVRHSQGIGWEQLL